MNRLRLLTAGESHGPGMSGILEGLPAGLRVVTKEVDRDLARRQHGYGSGRRMQIERDQVEWTAGLRFGRTLGSPLGLRNIVYERTQPQPAGFPPRVGRWLNVADREDLVAMLPDLTPLFDGVPGGSRFDGGVAISNGASPHTARTYLTTVEVGRAVAESLRVRGR